MEIPGMEIPESLIKHYAIRVRGRVQSVFFRASTKEVADEAGIRGWVRNEADGSVSIAAEGTEEQLQRLLTWCQKGPRLANVDGLLWKEEEPQGFTAFEVLR